MEYEWVKTGKTGRRRLMPVGGDVIHARAEVFYAPNCGGPKPRKGRAWPQASRAAGVALHLMKRRIAEAKRKGVDIRFTEKGHAIFDSRAHRKRYCEAMGMFDGDAGYGDAQGRRSHTEDDE